MKCFYLIWQKQTICDDLVSTYTKTFTYCIHIERQAQSTWLVNECLLTFDRLWRWSCYVYLVQFLIRFSEPLCFLIPANSAVCWSVLLHDTCCDVIGQTVHLNCLMFEPFARRECLTVDMSYVFNICWMIVRCL